MNKNNISGENIEFTFINSILKIRISKNRFNVSCKLLYLYDIKSLVEKTHYLNYRIWLSTISSQFSA